VPRRFGYGTRPRRGDHTPRGHGFPTRGSESASRPPTRFWCLNDKMIKELMTFAKCEIGKCLINYIEIIRYSRHMLWL
jgi:hypothetical protein